MQLEKSFGETIRDLRIENHLTLREVAKHLQIDTSMLGKIEKNNRNPSKQFIKDISNLFGIEEKLLIVAHLSDTVAYSILDEELASEVLQVAEEKINYYIKNKANK
ncbi:helix-turn-helix domain-containing protein [Flavobacterium glaciei]|uniref:Helix-turn-helix protein n=1 Tax=Flavobacterium glaciei TaxID=386300 RepID=A0A562PIL2_9FLAO|nr:helix-turn-helix transcriptional regulator [Flavobacterium glaciei]RDI49553.1 helix-turn-helix protein [Flavobacterium glaciei]TWI44218.1 helix-turn-helix protein [Flavobacterium glaciei]